MKTGRLKTALARFAKGVCIGGSMMIPGASGGTMAILLGVYDRLLRSISRFTSDVKGNLVFLAEVGAGGAVGVLLLSNVMLLLLERFEYPTMFFFLGAILAGIPVLYRKTGVKRLKPSGVGFAAVGFCIVLLLSSLPQGMISFGGGYDVGSFLLLLVAGVAVAVALVLPGISGSYMLLLLGMYDVVLRALKGLDFAYILPVLLGVGGGVLLTTGLLERAMEKHPTGTYFIIIGFVLGAAVDVFPGLPAGVDIPLSILTLAAGYAAIALVSKNAKE